MVLNLEGFEVEIHEDSFVWINDGTNIEFCEWKCLDPKLQDAFSGLKAKIEAAVENFVMSDIKSNFDAVAEIY